MHGVCGLNCRGSRQTPRRLARMSFDVMTTEDAPAELMLRNCEQCQPPVGLTGGCLSRFAESQNLVNRVSPAYLERHSVPGSPGAVELSHIARGTAYKSTGASVFFSIIHINIIVFLTVVTDG